MESNHTIRITFGQASKLLKLPNQFSAHDLIAAGYQDMASARAMLHTLSEKGRITRLHTGLYELSDSAKAALAKYRLPPGEQLQFGFSKEALKETSILTPITTNNTTSGATRLLNKLKSRKAELELELRRIEDYIQDLTDSKKPSRDSKQTEIIFPDLTEQEEEQLIATERIAQ